MSEQGNLYPSQKDLVEGATTNKNQHSSDTKVPPDNQRTPGEGGEKAGGGLQGA